MGSAHPDVTPRPAADKSLVGVHPVRTSRERQVFLKFPWRIYASDPMWVPPILAERAARINPARNPLFAEGDIDLFLAWRNGEVAGTIGLAIDPAHNHHRQEKVAFFGFFECREDYEIAQALWDQAIVWAKARNMKILRGPQSFGSSDEPGVLIEGRETPAGLLMGWSPPYYETFFTHYGFRKFHDSLAYRIDLTTYTGENGDFRAPEVIQRVADFAMQRYGARCRIRPGDFNDWDGELEAVRSVYNRSLALLPDFSPVSKEQWQRMAASIKTLMSPELSPLVEIDGQPVAFGLGLPDIMQALWHCNGLRFPWDYAKLWWHSRRLPGVSFKIMAMLPEYWGVGLDALIYLHLARESVRQGYQWMDLSLTGDDNPMTNKLARRFGATIDKRYRTYEIAI